MGAARTDPGGQSSGCTQDPEQAAEARPSEEPNLPAGHATIVLEVDPDGQ